MTITDAESAFVAATAESILLSQMFAVTPAPANPTYLVVSALDRNEYPQGSSGATGSFTGNGHTLKFSGQGGDSTGADIVFTYQAATGLYYNSVYGYFNQLVYNSSSSPNDVTNISVYATNSLMAVAADSGNAWTMMTAAEPAYVGSATVVTAPKFKSTVPAQATPGSISAVAESFVGSAWNMNGCWTLASTIAAEAGASLPVQTSEIGVPGIANGEWIVAFSGPGGQSGNWQSMLTTGEMIVFLTAGGTGHIATCVSGSGGTAELIDNVTYTNANGSVANLANDGSSLDVTVASPHPASQEFAGVSASQVVIYELDTPVVTDNESVANVRTGTTLSLAGLFSAADPAGKAITAWQVYDTAAADSLSAGGKMVSGHTAATALTVGSLAGVGLVAGSAAGADTLEVRAFNGSYWGDWQALSVSVQALSPPVLAQQTANQSWTEGSTIALALPAGTFTDPQSQALSYTASQSNGQALPSWLTFNAATRTFSGIAPTSTASMSITVTAADASGLSVAETFSAAVVAPAIAPQVATFAQRNGIVVTNPTPSQSWTDGQAVAFILPAKTFTDSSGQKMSFLAYQVSGPNVTSWLRFNAATDELVGTVPKTAAGTIGLEVIASDRLGYSATDMFTVALKPATTTTAHAFGAGSGMQVGTALPVTLENPVVKLFHG